MTEQERNEAQEAQRKFTMHYNIQDFVNAHQDHKSVRRPVSTQTFRKLSRLRSKTIVVEMDDIDVMFAADSLMGTKGKDDLYVRLKLGVSTVSPGNRKAYEGLKLLKARDPEGDSTLPPANLIEDALTATKPDQYCKKVGREKAQRNLHYINALVESICIEKGRGVVTILCENEGICFDYVKNFDTGSVRAYLRSVDGFNMRSSD